MEDTFINFASATAARDAAFTEITTKNAKLTTQIRQKEDKIWSVQADMCNLKVVAAAQTTGHVLEGGGSGNTGGNLNTCMQNGRGKWPTNPTKKNYNNDNYCWSHGYDTSGPHSSWTCTHTKYGYKKESTCCNPMGLSQVNKLRYYKKG